MIKNVNTFLQKFWLIFGLIYALILAIFFLIQNPSSGIY